MIEVRGPPFAYCGGVPFHRVNRAGYLTAPDIWWTLSRYRVSTQRASVGATMGSLRKRLSLEDKVAPPPTVTQPRRQDEALYPMLVRVPRELHEKAKRRAEAEDRTLAMVVRRALRDYLSRPVG